MSSVCICPPDCQTDRHFFLCYLNTACAHSPNSSLNGTGEIDFPPWRTVPEGYSGGARCSVFSFYPVTDCNNCKNSVP